MKRLKRLLTVMLLALLAWNCQKEGMESSLETDSKTDTEEPELKIEEIEFESFEQEPFYNALNDYLGFEQMDANASKRKRKHKFRISRKHVKKVERKSGDYTSYTFYMTDEDLRDPTILQNLMVVKRKGELEVYRFLYGGTEKRPLPKDYDMARNTTFEKLLDFDMDQMGSLTSKNPCLFDQLDCDGGGDNDNGGAYCYNVEIYIDYACSGNGATGQRVRTTTTATATVPMATAPAARPLPTTSPKRSALARAVPTVPRRSMCPITIWAVGTPMFQPTGTTSSYPPRWSLRYRTVPTHWPLSWGWTPCLRNTIGSWTQRIKTFMI